MFEGQSINKTNIFFYLGRTYHMYDGQSIKKKNFFFTSDGPVIHSRVILEEYFFFT